MTELPPDGTVAGRKTPRVQGDRYRLSITVKVGPDWHALFDAHPNHRDRGPDVLVVTLEDRGTLRMTGATGPAVEVETTGMTLTFSTTLFPGSEPGRIRCVLAGAVQEIKTQGLKLEPEAWRGLFARMAARNVALGYTMPEGLPAESATARAEDFKVAAGFVPMHKLSERNAAGLPLFPERNKEFHALRTPMAWTVGLALFKATSPSRPGEWQEVKLADLADQVLCLTERGAPRRGDQVPDMLAEVVKLFAETTAIARQRPVQHGRLWATETELLFHRVIAELGLVYLDTQTGRQVRPEDPGLPQDAVVPLVVKGRRAYQPDGKDTLALIGNRWKLETIRWRWSPTIADDLLAAPLLDKKGNVVKDRKGNVLRGGWHTLVAVNIFDALFRLREERAFVAHDLLVLLATDIYKPPPQDIVAGRAKRNEIERNAERLFDQLGLELDPKNPRRREEMVEAAIFRLKQPDIAALLPGSDERPRLRPGDRSSGRRKNGYYRLVRSALFIPAGILSKDDALALKAEQTDTKLDALLVPAVSATPEEELPGLPAPPLIPSGHDIRLARRAAGIDLREFARRMDGHPEVLLKKAPARPDFSTWSRYESGKPIRVGNIAPEVWERVWAFIIDHPAPDDPEGQEQDE